jgi:hypothetical protein
MPRRLAVVSRTAVRTMLALALLAGPARLAAQVRGQVVDTDGRPLPGVLVELWDGGRRLAGDGSDATGRFRLPAPPAAGPRAVLARGIGLEPMRRGLGTGDSVIILVMRPHAVELAAATVVAGEILCPSRDQAEARALWTRAVAHYDVALSAYSVYSEAQVFAAVVSPESLGVVDTSRLRETTLGGGYSALAFATRFTTAANYYAVRTGGRFPRRYDRWSYQVIESSRAWHFADAFFASMNRLALEPEPVGDTAIAFCSSEGDRPYIRGRLHLAPDLTLASAEWEFVTPSPHEEAGGRVLFAPVDPQRTGQPLVPMAGLFWRRTGRRAYEEWTEFRQWYRCEGPLSCEAPVPIGAPPSGHPPPEGPPPERPRPDRPPPAGAPSGPPPPARPGPPPA